MGYGQYQKIPCGQCIECRLSYSRQWAHRIMMEAKYHKHNWFVTLTYNEENLPRTERLDMESGEVISGNSLRIKDIQKYHKRLRRRHPNDGIRFFTTGEYGDRTERAHYHEALFGAELSDLKQISVGKQGQAIYQSEDLANIWGQGQITIEELCWDNAAYIARYMVKKQKGEAGKLEYDLKGRKAPFSCMSTKPGIGYQYFVDHAKDMYLTDSITLPKAGGGHITERIPRYFDKKMAESEPEQMQSRKEQRERRAETMDRLKQEQTSMNSWEIMQATETVERQKIHEREVH